MADASNWTIRSFDEDSDYELFKSWWMVRHGDAPHPSFLPPVSVVVEKEGEVMAFGFAHCCNARAIAHTEWFTTKPGLLGGTALKTYKHLLSGMEETLKALGIEAIIGWVPHKVMALQAEKLGYSVASEDVITLLKILK